MTQNHDPIIQLEEDVEELKQEVAKGDIEGAEDQLDAIRDDTDIIGQELEEQIFKKDNFSDPINEEEREE